MQLVGWRSPKPWMVWWWWQTVVEWFSFACARDVFCCCCLLSIACGSGDVPCYLVICVSSTIAVAAPSASLLWDERDLLIEDRDTSTGFDWYELRSSSSVNIWSKTEKRTENKLKIRNTKAGGETGEKNRKSFLSLSGWLGLDYAQLRLWNSVRFTVFHHITLLLFGLLVGVLYIHPYTFTQPPQHFAWCQCVNVKCNKRQARHRHLNGCFVLITSFHVFCRHLIILFFFRLPV